MGRPLRSIGALAFLSLLLLTSLTLPKALSSEFISSYAVYYGSDAIQDLQKFDMVILSPLIESEATKELNEKGVITIGYVSISTVGGWEPWANEVTEDIIVGSVAYWNEIIVDVCNIKWKKILLDDIIPYVIHKGFRGVFFDNLDIVHRYPDFKRCIIDLIKDVRERYPNLVIVVNRGFELIGDIAPYIDYVMFESFGTYYNFKTHRYEKWVGDDYVWMIREASYLEKVRERYGIGVLALGYADPKNFSQLEDYCNYVYSLAKKYGFIPYISDVNLRYVNTRCIKLSVTSGKSYSKSVLSIVLIIVVMAAISLYYTHRLKRS